MKIVNVNGRLETTGTWEDLAEQAAACKASIMQQRTELRAMLSGNMQFYEDPHGLPVVGVDLGAPEGDKTVVVEKQPAPVKGFQFRVGDIVECIEPDENQGLQAGCRYRVRGVTINPKMIQVTDRGDRYFPKRFKLVQRTRYEVGDEVRAAESSSGAVAVIREVLPSGAYRLQWPTHEGGLSWTAAELTPVL